MSKEPKIKPIVIVGAGGMGRDTQWLIERINEEEPTYEILGYIDDGIQQGSIIDGYPILGGMKYLEEYDKEQKLAVAFAIGNAKVREKLVLKCLPNPNLWYNNFAMLGNGLKWSFPNICVTNLLLVEWKFIISTRE